MQHNAKQYRARRRAVMSAVMVLAGIVGIALLMTACGSSGTSSTDAANPGSSNSTSGNSTSGNSISARYAKAVAYSQCVRSHGVPDFPDPTDNGGNIGLTISNLKESQSTLQAAENACKSLNPVHPLTGTALAQNTAEGLKWAQCIRAHGVPDFPDPNSSGAFDLPSGLNPQSASLQAAMNACQSVRPKQIMMGSGAPGGSAP